MKTLFVITAGLFTFSAAASAQAPQAGGAERVVVPHEVLIQIKQAPKLVLPPTARNIPLDSNTRLERKDLVGRGDLLKNFEQIDINQDGALDSSEVMAYFEPSSRVDRKAAAAGAAAAPRSAAETKSPIKAK